MDPSFPLTIIGIATAAYLLIRLLDNVYHYAIYNYSYTSFRDKWAVITGASAGIGLAFAERLAARGVNVVLIARSKDKLDAHAETLAKSHNVQTRAIAFDFSKATTTDYSALSEQLISLNPSILINNVGVNVEFPTDFVDIADDDITRIVDVNVRATNKMTHMLLPGMIAAGKGIVMCLSSGGGAVSPAPMLAAYAGTKAYNDAFAVALAGEVAGKGVMVHSLTPFFVESAMAKMRASLTVPTCAKFADCALRLVGSSPRLQPYWVHYIMGAALTILPLSMQVKYVDGLHRNIRMRALRKRERLAKQS